MSLRQVKEKINLIEAAIREREKKLSIIENQKNIEDIVKIPLIKNEISILQAEKGRLAEEVEKIKASLEQALPEAERKYLDACEEQKRVLKKLYEATEKFLSCIEDLKTSIKTTHYLFIPYKNISLELEKAPKNLHIEDLYSLNEKVIAQTRIFYEWLRERVNK